MVTNTTKWKQSGTTIYRQSDVDEFDVGFNPIYIDDDDDNETIYIAETTKNRVIAFQSHATNFKVVAGGNGIGDGTHQIFQPTDIVIDKKTNSMLICDSGNTRIVRWSRQNARDGRIVISNVYCNGLAMDDKGYLYVSDWLKYEVKRWDIGTTNTNTIVAGGNGGGNGLGQLQLPGLIFVDRDYSVYVVDTSNHRLMKWMKGAKKGLVVAGGNDNGTTLKHLSSPLGMIVDHLGNIYVSDTKNNRVMRWINGATEGSIVVGGNGEGNQKNQLNRPTDLSFDKHGNLYVFDSVNQRLQKFDIESN
jgi:sugar lactone lactonase YvrE